MKTKSIEVGFTDADGIDRDVRVDYIINPPEPDIGWPGDTEIEAVWTEQGNIYPDMGENSIELLISALEMELTGIDPDDGRGDWEYDMKKDREVGL